MSSYESKARRVGFAAAALSAVVAAALLLAGCATQSGSSQASIPLASAGAKAVPTAASTPPSDATAGLSLSAPTPVPVEAALPAAESQATPLAAEAPRAFATPARCIDEQLSLEYQALPDESGAGQSGFNLRFRNVSADPCIVWGWPGVSPVGADGALIGWPAQSEGNDGPTITLQPQDVAVSHVRLGAAGAFGCPIVTAVGLRAFVTSDGVGGGPGVTVAHTFDVCADETSTMHQGVFVAG